MDYFNNYDQFKTAFERHFGIKVEDDNPALWLFWNACVCKDFGGVYLCDPANEVATKDYSLEFECDDNGDVTGWTIWNRKNGDAEKSWGVWTH